MGRSKESIQRMVAAKRRARAERVAIGACIDCAAPSKKGGVRCLACASVAAERARAYYHAHAERCRKEANARYHAKHPQARYLGPRKAVTRAA